MMSAPYDLVASILGSGAPSGMITVALAPSRAAAKATPWAWLPALAATTPRARSASVSREIRRYAPRALNDPVRCRFSHFRKTGPPRRSDSTRERSSGVGARTPRSTSRAAAVSSGRTGEDAVVMLCSLALCRPAFAISLAGPVAVGGEQQRGGTDQPGAQAERRRHPPHRPPRRPPHRALPSPLPRPARNQDPHAPATTPPAGRAATPRPGRALPRLRPPPGRTDVWRRRCR